MDDPHRMQTLHALEMFIHTQRTLLAQQRADIDRLQRLRVELVQRPAHLLANLGRELDDDAFRLSEQVSCRLALPKDIDWSVFEKSDTGPFRTLAQQKRDELAQRSRPSPTQSSAQLSELQRFVKRSRRTIVDPVLARCAALSAEIESNGASEEEEEEEDPEALRRREEQQKIRELKTRMIRGGGGGLRVPLSSTAGAMGVFVRPDVEEAAMDVDVSIDDDDEGENGKGKGANGVVPPPLALDMGSDTPSPPPLPAKAAVVPVPPGKKMKGSSVRRHAGKKNLPPPPVFDNAVDDDDKEDEAYGLPPLPQKQLPPRKIVKLKIPARSKRVVKYDEGEDEDDDDGEPIVEEEAKPKTKGRRAGNAKPKPETYKQAWSESEQNLLEQLLEEIPEGEKFRWQKISRAMGGRRTPRQVASRVQKYFEKLKRFGLMVDGCGSG